MRKARARSIFQATWDGPVLTLASVLLGGSITIAATFLQAQAQSQQAREAFMVNTRRDTYASFLAKSQEQARQLRLSATEISSATPESAVAETLTKMRDATQIVSAAEAEVAMIASPSTAEAATKVADVFTECELTIVDGFVLIKDEAGVPEANKEIMKDKCYSLGNSIDAFVQRARADLGLLD